MSSAFGFGGVGGGPKALIRQFGKGDDDGSVGVKTFVRLLAFLAPYRRTMALSVLSMAVSTVLTIAVPWYLKIAIDRHIAGGDFYGLLTISLIIVLLFVLIFAFGALQGYLLSRVGHRLLSDLRRMLFTHLQELSLGYHTTHIAGVTISRIIGDVAVIKDLLSQGVVTLIGDVFILSGVVTIMLTMDVRLALASFTVVPIMVVVTLLFSRRAKRAFRETRRGVAAVVGGLAENISGMRIIQAFGQEESILDRFGSANQRNRDAHVAAMSLSFTFIPSVEFLGVCATAIVLAYGGVGVIAGNLTLGVLVAFLSYISRLFQPLQELGQLFATLQAALAGGQRILDFLDIEPAVVDAPNAAEVGRIRGTIAFRGVTFSYNPGEPVLHDLTFRLNAGETVAIVGKTGSGKTTIINLVARFYDVDSGAVTVDGTDVRAVTQRSLRRNLGLVSQDPFLFPGTIEENIRLSDVHGERGHVEEAARAAAAHDFISTLPEGYRTVVLENGSNLSTGQKQLISIARAIYADPRVIVLDEATANVDTVTEQKIQRGLDRLFAGRTAVVVAHRLSTVLSADRIIVLAAGRMLDYGPHRELLDRCDTYRIMYESQFVER